MKHLIDVDALKKKLFGENPDPTHMAAIECKDLDAIPLIDAVEVVRCCECSFYRTNTEYDFNFCKLHRCGMNPNNFCSDGERK